MSLVRFLSPALDEIAAALEHYGAVSPSAAGRFLDEMDRAVAHLEATPRIGRPAGNGARRLSLHGFPYDLIYRLIDDEVAVSAVAHWRRDPETWKRR